MSRKKNPLIDHNLKKSLCSPLINNPNLGVFFGLNTKQIKRRSSNDKGSTCIEEEYRNAQELLDYYEINMDMVDVQIRSPKITKLQNINHS